MNNALLDDLHWRGLIYQQTDPDGLANCLNTESIAAYVGVDPTADSLHIGHLVPFIMLRRFQNAGHKPIIIIGGGTGLIGDPSGKKEERVLQSLEKIQTNCQKLELQIRRLFSNDSTVVFANNYDWIGTMTLPDFLRDVGKRFNLNTMLAKESVASRLQGGISFTEFTYQIIQALDFKVLYDRYNCRLQIGGSDQWGNITAGLDYIRKTVPNSAPVFGLTIPLVTKADGKKFGKTEQGTIWLDSEKTSPYAFYQFWYNTSDADVLTYLKFFTFLSREEIDALAESCTREPSKRKAQRALAEEMTRFVHGEEALQQVQRITQALFVDEIETLSISDIRMGLSEVPHIFLQSPRSIVDCLVELKAATSKRMARELLEQGAIRVNGSIVTDETVSIDAKHALHQQITIIRRGKKNYYVIYHTE